MSARRKRKSLDKSQYLKGYTLVLKNITKEQEKYFNYCIGPYRKIFNWTLDINDAHYNEHKHDKKYKPLTDSQMEALLSEYRNQNEWLRKVPLGTLRNAMFDALNARYYWLNPKINIKHPKYKTKKKSKKSFSPRADRCYLDDNMLKIEGVKDKINIGWDSGFVSRYKKDGTEFMNVRIFKDTNGKWKISFTVIANKPKNNNYNYSTNTYTPSYNRAIGIDINKENLLVDSYMNGNIHKIPESVEKYYKKACELQKAVTRDIKLTKKRYPEITNWDNEDLSEYKSNNAKKRQIKAAKARRKVHNIVDTYTHTIAKDLITKYPKAIVMENINFRKWYKYHSQISGISYIPFSNIRKIFQEKCNKYNVPFILARKDYPSTQRCSCCGSLKKMGSKHTYRCPVCGNKMDRDINAAFNLEQYYNYTDALIWKR